MGMLKVENIARILHLDRTYFTSLFTRSVGMSPKKYLTAVRIKKAIELLKGDISLTEIAYATGYSNVYHFSKVFKRETKVSPSEYRKKLKNRSN